MSASHHPVMRATALQAVAALARYERHVRRLAATWLDMELYQTVSEELDEIRKCCDVLPQVMLPWTALLISHSDLIHALWRSQGGTGEDARRQLQDHLACIDALARRCLRTVESRPGER